MYESIMVPSVHLKSHARRNAFIAGMDWAKGIVGCNDAPRIGTKLEYSLLQGEWRQGEEVDADNCTAIYWALLFDAEEGARCYSPFEFTAARFNKSRARDALWAAFEAGTEAVFSEAVKAADYEAEEEYDEAA